MGELNYHLVERCVEVQHGQRRQADETQGPVKAGLSARGQAPGSRPA